MKTRVLYRLMNNTLMLSGLLLINLSTAMAITPSIKANWSQWPIVGEATLTWFVFDVYHSKLLTPIGRYEETDDVTPHPLALEIDYLRNISKQQFLDAVDEQWQHLGITQPTRIRWLAVLSPLFPDIKKGQKLAYVTDGSQGELFFQTVSDWQTLGTVSDQSLNDAFIAIWLSPETAYPTLRRQLIGQRSKKK